MKNYILTTKFIFCSLLVTLISIESSQVFANPCAIPLIQYNDKRLESLSSEAKDMIFISSLMASQFSSTTTLKANFAIMLLSHFTEVRVDGQSFSLIGKTVFRIFESLSLLEGVQQFLLAQLGLSVDNLGLTVEPFFSLREGGGLIFHLPDSPAISAIIHQFRHNPAINMFLNKISSLENKGPLDEHLTFSEFLFLMGPTQSFLSKALNGDRQDLISILSEAFQKLEHHHQVNNRRHANHTSEQRTQIIEEAIQIFAKEPGIEDSVVAERISQKLGRDIKIKTLRNRIFEHQKANGPIPGRQQRSFSFHSSEQRTQIMEEAMRIFAKEPGIEDSVVAERISKKLGIEITKEILQSRIYRHETANGPIPGRRQRPYSFHSPEQRTQGIEEAMRIFAKEPGINVSVVAERISKKLGIEITKEILQHWLYQNDRRLRIQRAQQQ